MPGETFHWFDVHVEDLGEPGNEPRSAGKKNNICTDGGSGTDAFATNIFRTDLNPSSGGRSFNLRTDISTTPTTGGGYTNTDFLNDGNGGICLSCHKTAQNKSYAQTDGTTSTPVIPYSGGAAADYAAGPHGAYTVSSTFTKDSSTFSANCSKCHNYTLSKGMQSSASKFGLHDSTLRRMLAPLGIGSPTDPLEEQFCLQCHSGGVAGNDYYGVASMSQSAKRLTQYLREYAQGNATFTSGGTSVSGSGSPAPVWYYSGTATFQRNSNQVTNVTAFGEGCATVRRSGDFERQLQAVVRPRPLTPTLG